jgi:glycosyltransferase involved in cell wall biosynthesis
MASITALLFTQNDALRLGRALETVYACDEILVVDQGSRDETVRVAREYGARVVDARPGLSPADYARSSGARSGGAPGKDPGWILCLDPNESLTEKLAASLFEWKSEAARSQRPVYSVFLREETAEGWVDISAAQTRLVPDGWNAWNGRLPIHEPKALALEGELLRFVFP